MAEELRNQEVTELNKLYLEYLGQEVSNVLIQLNKLSGIDPSSVYVYDNRVIEIFVGNERKFRTGLNLLGVDTNTFYEIVRTTKLESINDLIKIMGLVLGQGTWKENAQILISESKISLSKVITNEDDLLDELRDYGLDEEIAFNIIEAISKGKFDYENKEYLEWKSQMINCGIPDWLIWSCQEIKKLVPKLQAQVYAYAAWILAWYQCNYPIMYDKVLSEHI